MTFDPNEVRAGPSVLLAASIEAIFKFIPSAEKRLAAGSPLEVRIETQGESVLESRYNGGLEIAGRVLRYEARTSVYEPPGRLVVEIGGDFSGEQVFNLAEESNFTRLNYDLQYSVPPELPSYFRE